MKDHLRKNKNSDSPACGSFLNHRGAGTKVLIMSPLMFSKSDYRCQKCEKIFFEKLEEARKERDKNKNK